MTHAPNDPTEPPDETPAQHSAQLSNQLSNQTPSPSDDTAREAADEAAQEARDLLAVARRKYRRLAQLMDEAIDNLRHCADEGVSHQLLGDYEKALTIVFDRTARLENLTKKETSHATGAALDLDAARTEIQRRLARLAATSGTDGLP